MKLFKKLSSNKSGEEMLPSTGDANKDVLEKLRYIHARYIVNHKPYLKRKDAIKINEYIESLTQDVLNHMPYNVRSLSELKTCIDILEEVLNPSKKNTLDDAPLKSHMGTIQKSYMGTIPIPYKK